MFNWFLSMFLEAQCPLCKRTAAGGLLCRSCDRQLEQYQCSNPQVYWQGSLPLFVWGKYEGLLKRAITTMKYDNQPELGTWLGEQLARTWQQSSPYAQKLTAIPIPMHPNKRQQRGFNQAELIAKRFAQINGLRCDAKSLVRQKSTKALFELDRAQRQREIHQAFALKPEAMQRLKQQPVLLVDDIYTSGTTAREAQRTLAAQGITVIGIAAIATPQLNQQTRRPKKPPNNPAKP